MPTTINANFFPLGLISPTPGSPLDIFQNFSDLRGTMNFASILYFQSYWGNTGRCYVGTASLNVGSTAGINVVLMTAGDSFALSGAPALNVLNLASYRIDVQNPGDGVLVSVLVR